MGKRGNQSTGKVATKKVKVEPALALVVDAVKKAGHLPEQCSAMLAGMLPFSLAIASDERADCQKRVVGMVEETLSTMKSEMQAAVGSEEVKLAEVKATMEGLERTVQGSAALLTAKTEALQTANAALAEATSTVNASGETLSERQAAQKAREADLASVQENKSALEQAFQTHFQVPMEAGQGPNFKELEPFIKTMDIEKSMFQTLPGTCGKSKEDRGSFDQVILEQLEKAIVGKIASLGETVIAETAAVAECELATKDAETDFNAKQEVQKSSTSAFEAAQSEQSEADAALLKANEAVNNFSPQLEEATKQFETTKAMLETFEGGPFTNFMTYKEKTLPVEVATAGA